MLNKRCLEILKLIVTSKKIQTVDELSLKFSVSKRMIRYDIDAINDYLGKHNISQIQKKANSPLKVDLNQEEQERMLKVIDELNTDSYILSTKERIGILLYELLSSDKPNTYSELQEKLSISKTTLMSDIKKVKEWLKSYNLLIEKFSNKGVTIKGEELDVRRAITTLLVDDTEYNIITLLEGVYKQITLYDFNDKKKFTLSTVNVGYIHSLVVEIEDEFGMFSDYDFMNLTAAIYIVINRSLQKKAPLKSMSNSIRQCYKKEYEAAYKVSQHINDKFGIVVNDDELSYLITRILSASKNNSNIFDSIDYFEACTIADLFVLGIRRDYYPTFEFDEKLLESFINHLKSLISRIKYNEQSKNPALDLIKKSYNQEFIMMKELSKIMEDKLNCEISEDEVGYLTMYVCSTLQKNTPIKLYSTKNILIVCSSGFATGRVLEYRIKDIFDVNIIGVTSTHRVVKFIESDEIDYIVTTVKLNLRTHIPILNVSAIFTNEEINYLKQFLSYKINQFPVNIDDVLEIISKNCHIINKASLVKDLNQYFKTKSEVKLKNIKQYITSDIIQLNLDVEDWQDAIIKSANPLLKKGSIETEYIQAIIDNVNQFGAYIVVDEGVAIPHAKPDWYIHDFGITISTFKTPFSMGDHDDIQVFIMLASVNNQNHITLVTQIMKLIENKRFMDGLINASNTYEVIELLNQAAL